jgi:hypothetical protein
MKRHPPRVISDTRDSSKELSVIVRFDDEKISTTNRHNKSRFSVLVPIPFFVFCSRSSLFGLLLKKKPERYFLSSLNAGLFESLCAIIEFY